MLDGKADGTPPLATRDEYQQWVDVCSKVYLQLCDKVKRSEHTFFDSYAATNEAEFFAVVTEYFFSNPAGMRRYYPELYEVLQGFYRQDPAEKVLAGSR